MKHEGGTTNTLPAPHQPIVLPRLVQVHEEPWREQTDRAVLAHHHVPEVGKILDAVHGAEPQVLVHVVGDAWNDGRECRELCWKRG